MNETEELSIKKLLNNKEKYVIPLYQRNYDWGEKETLQLLDDIADYAKKEKNGQSQNYYIGTLVVHELENAHEIIDGQQRMTTLTLLLCAVKNDKTLRSNIDFSWFSDVNLSYINRDKANEALRILYKGEALDNISIPSMRNVYQHIQSSLDTKCVERRIDVPFFMDYLLNKVHILQVAVPQDTDLNHYFEIMNSRGEQLEKHEIVKALLMGKLEPKYHDAFKVIWEACSNMDSYVIRNFTNNKIRRVFFRDDNTMWPDEFEDLNNDFIHRNDNDETSSDNNSVRIKDKSICDLIEEARNNKHYPNPFENGNRQSSERFGSIINFPNFLLHVLKIVYQDYFKNQTDDEIIALDDKDLVDIFGEVLYKVGDNFAQTFVIKYIHQLLRLRYLFDEYVIKRDNSNMSDERISWSLNKVNKEGNYSSTFGTNDTEDDAGTDTRQSGFEAIQIRMLESMFHVSAPTQSYKYWLLAVLNYIDKNEPLDRPTGLADYLFRLAQDYMRYRYLGDKQSKFFDIIFNHETLPPASTIQLDWERLNNGTRVPHFVFNYYDFIQWRSNPNNYKDFGFTYRTSVEHFYPQHPIDNNRELDNVDKFGNLCLISGSVNSKFSNNMPKAKWENFGKNGKSKYSIKLQELFDVAEKNVDWDENLIDKLTEEAINKIRESL